MKTLKTRILPGILILAAALPFLLTSCKDDLPDLRDEVVGQYSYTLKIYREVGDDLVYAGDVGDVGDISGTMRVIKNSGEPDVLDFFDGNVLMFHGVNVKDAGNAIVFDVPMQEAWVGPTIVEIVGYNYWDVNSSQYHGAFLYDDDSLEIAFSARVMDIGTGLVMILTAFKK